MPTTLPLEEAQLRLRELIEQLAPGEEVIITADARPIARLVAGPVQVRPAPGLGHGSILSMAPDFDDPIEDLKGELVRSQPGGHSISPRR